MKKLILDSSLCPDPSKPVWYFDDSIDCFRYRLNTVILPLSYDTINDTNNKIVIKEGSGNHTDVFINRGNYSIAQLAPELARALTSYGTQTYTVTYDPVTSQLKISAPSNFQIINYESNAHWLGLKKTSVTDPTNTLILPKRYDLSGVKFILMVSTSIRSEGIVYVGNDTYNIVEILPIKQDLSTVQVLTNEFPDDFIISKTSNLNSVDLLLLDGISKKPLDLRGEPFIVILDIDEER